MARRKPPAFTPPPTMNVGTNGHANGADKQLDRLDKLVGNAMLMRSELISKMLDARRNIDHDCGYPDTADAYYYQSLFDRDPIAARVAEVLPKEAWQVQPLVFESDDADNATPFEAAWDALGNGLRTEESFHQDEAGSPVWEYLLRADVLSGIGQYGVILFGIDDGKELREPVQGFQDGAPTKAGTKKGQYVFNASPKEHQLLFLRVFPETLSQITQWEQDARSPRYGQPKQYLLQFYDPSQQSGGGLGAPMSSVQVHWSRIQHVADTSHQAGSSETLAVPRMRPVLNRILDLRKIYGADGEGFWRGAFPGLSIEMNPNNEFIPGEDDKSAMRDMIEQYQNTLQRYIALTGFTAKSLAPQVVDPTPHIDKQIEAICIKLGIPVRVFMGSERGNLASAQDDDAWNDRLKERQKNYMTPRLIVPFIDRLIALGCLPKPSGYTVEWPDITSQSAATKAGVLLQRTQAYAAYVGGSVESIIPPLDYMTKFDDMDEEVAMEILEEAEKAEEEKIADEQALAEEQGMIPTPPEGFENPQPEELEQPIKVKEGEKLVKSDGKPFIGNDEGQP